MSLLTNLLRLIPPTLRPNYCPQPSTYQQLANDIIGGTRVTFLVDTGSFLYNLGPTTPAAEDRVYPWLNTTLNRWYTFSGGYWIAPYPIIAGPNGFRILWVGQNDGSAGGLWAIDEGDGLDPATGPGTPTPISGSFWEIDTDFEGRVPIGPGSVPGSSPNIAITVGSTGGEARHALTALEGAMIAHSHYFGISNPASDDAYFRHLAAPVATPNYLGFYITGGAGTSIVAQTTADLETLPNTVATLDPFSVMQPYRGCWFIKRTARAFYRLPA